MTEYIKIDTLFRRDMEGTRKLLEGEFRDETVEFLQDLPWVMTEKIDGMNIGVAWDGHQVSFQGRTERANLPGPLLERLTELFGDGTGEELFEEKFGEMPVVLFGEGYGQGIRSGGAYRPDMSFILFDVYLPDQDLWLTRESVEDIARAFGIEVVPIVGVGTLREAVEFVKTKPPSTIGKARMEGVVCRPRTELRDRRGRRVIVKIKWRDFV